MFTKYICATNGGCRNAIQPADQQVTSKIPTTNPKIPKQVVTGKAIAAKTKQTRKEQKKALVEARVIIANNLAKETSTVAEVRPDTRNVFSTNQWLSVISIKVSMFGL